MKCNQHNSNFSWFTLCELWSPAAALIVFPLQTWNEIALFLLSKCCSQDHTYLNNCDIDSLKECLTFLTTVWQSYNRDSTAVVNPDPKVRSNGTAIGKQCVTFHWIQIPDQDSPYFYSCVYHYNFFLFTQTFFIGDNTECINTNGKGVWRWFGEFRVPTDC
jgi:hypothetical protein